MQATNLVKAGYDVTVWNRNPGIPYMKSLCQSLDSQPARHMQDGHPIGLLSPPSRLSHACTDKSKALKELGAKVSIVLSLHNGNACQWTG